MAWEDIAKATTELAAKKEAKENKKVEREKKKAETEARKAEQEAKTAEKEARKRKACSAVAEEVSKPSIKLLRMGEMLDPTVL
ncbi:uncharacterized protein PV09_09705 [Verruconis gallopava]|uniref:Uncharacterized protein n=1 Tax=Verruconis gallopava TaxID=253628 RepID=A0A0D2AHW3_9PEZI|nr:uncharacterized protein PV09_09705 [Verruconis gallopava]KIV98488.1 hypothetical protein PV09_09705 [Verruconis gallopava]